MPVTIDGTTGISGPASGLTDLNASNLSTGTVPNARFPATLPAASGVNLTSLNASNISSGTLAVANGGTGVTTSTGTGSVVLSNSPTLVSPALGTPSSGNGSNLTSLNASNLSTGTVPTARLGTGTADSTTFLRGDGTWQAVSSTPTTAQVLSATAGATAGAVGTYGFMLTTVVVDLTLGATIAGSSLKFSGCTISGSFRAGGPTASGTWRIVGYMDLTNPGTTGASVFLRIS